MECPVVQLPKPAAQYDRDKTFHGKFLDSFSLASCTTCNMCDMLCPAQVNPYELVLERFDAQLRLNGLPGIARMVFPNEYWNIWSLLRPLMDENETKDLQLWEYNLSKKHKTILLTGFYSNIVPYLLQYTFIKQNMPPIAGAEGLWGCGGDSNKLGLIDITESIVKMLDKQFRSMGVKRIICFMEAEAAMLEEVIPKRYGVRFSPRAIPMDYHLLNEISKRKIIISSPLRIKITVHDNCMSRYFGGKPQEAIRKILRQCGCTIVEMEHSRDRALCCGWAATIPSLHAGRSLPGTVLYMAYSLNLRLIEAEKTGAEALVTGCPACYIFLSLIAYLTNRKIRIHHTVEIVGIASGEKFIEKSKERCIDIIAVIVMLIIQYLRSSDFRKRIHPKAPDPASIQPLPQLQETHAKQLQKIRKILGGKIIQSRFTRTMIGWSLRAAIRFYAIILKIRRSRFIQTAVKNTREKA